MTRPLPEDVARTARAYLAALVPAPEVSDAWHELVADATYWGDRELVPVVRLAHQVALQHQPVAPEVAVLALHEVGIDQDASIARVLDVDEDAARAWSQQVAASVVGDADVGAGEDAGGQGAGRFSEPGPSHARSAPVHAPGPAPEPDDLDAAPSAGPSGNGGDAVRIGFEDDGPLPSIDELDSPASTTPRRGLVVAVVVVAVLLVLAVWLLGG